MLLFGAGMRLLFVCMTEKKLFFNSRTEKNSAEYAKIICTCVKLLLLLLLLHRAISFSISLKSFGWFVPRALVSLIIVHGILTRMIFKLYLMISTPRERERVSVNMTTQKLNTAYPWNRTHSMYIARMCAAHGEYSISCLLFTFLLWVCV